MIVLGGVAATVVVLGAGAFYFLMSEEEPPAPIVRRAVTPATPTPAASAPAEAEPAAAKGPITQAKQTIDGASATRADSAEVIDAAANPGGQTQASPAASTADDSARAPADATVSAAPATTIEPAPARASPPPPSAAFRAWVQNLRVSGVRGGANPRVFIERTAYGPGDLVNPQLGIRFDTYNAETRMLVFKDASGAVVERRN